ncbi:hypothetical protein RchiOBHm_Chr3g0458431 [Rosa chinensis]|uniref:Uncharacterized protein n=1 Tax=Rosa chinensis TaxID=74649 RepID=A0A2P6R7U9_ROSCH|nr:hypothetical protein RchiOBHm_Chr3g0458431 [Rosa chinensis]
MFCFNPSICISSRPIRDCRVLLFAAFFCYLLRNIELHYIYLLRQIQSSIHHRF